MATGDQCAILGPPSPPDDDAAIPDFREDGSTPAGRIEIVKFPNGSVSYYIDYEGYFENYDGSSGITVTGRCSFDTITSGNAVVQIDILVIPTTYDIDGSKTYSYTTDTIAVPGTNGQQVEFSIDLAHETGMADGGHFIIRILRDPTHASDSAANTMELWARSVRVVSQ